MTTATWVALVLLRGSKLNLSLLTSLGFVIAVVGFLMASIDRFLWRLPAFNLLFRISPPMISGTWKGEVRSSRREAPFEVFLVVTQTLSRVSVRMLTEDGWSETLSSRWGRSDARNHAVYYVWRRFPEGSSSRSGASERPGYIGHGAGLLEVCGPRGHSLEGRYWTDERHVGQMLFERHHRRRCRTYPAAVALFEGS